ncbi:MAG: tetratricopeptide repeat protein, partial [Lewinella sp.]|nr:tetratricopeptide repeat protein [Lewinella sp.]
QKQGQYPEAKVLLEHDLELCRELGDWQGISIAEALLGELYGAIGQFAEAINHLQQSLRISQELGYQKGVARAVNTLGDVHYWKGDYLQSLAFYEQAIAIARKTDNQLVLASSLLEKGLVLLELGLYAELQAIQQVVWPLVLNLGNPSLVVDAKLLQARSLALAKDFSAALEIIQALVNDLNLNAEQQAAAYFERFRISSRDTEARDLAHALYTQLFQETPKHQYQTRLQQLRES